jgi:hypothetical protein
MYIGSEPCSAQQQFDGRPAHSAATYAPADISVDEVHNRIFSRTEIYSSSMQWSTGRQAVEWSVHDEMERNAVQCRRVQCSSCVEHRATAV